MNKLSHLDYTLTRMMVLLGCVAATLGVAALDFITGIKIDMSVFYFFPVAWAAIVIHRRAGLWIALLATVLFFGVNIPHYRDALVFACINTGMHSVCFIAIGFVFSFIKEEKEKIEVLDKELAKTQQQLSGKREGRASQKNARSPKRTQSP